MKHRPGFISTEKKQDATALIVDKTGIVLEALAEKLCKELFVVCVTRSPRGIHTLQNTIYISYRGRFPSIPNYAYSYIFLVDDATTVTRKLLSKLAEKAESDKSQLIFIARRADLLEKQLFRLIEETKRSTKIVIVGDIFKRDLFYDERISDSLINRFINETIRKRKIKIEGDGLKQTYPVSLEDSVSGILEAVFDSHKDSLFYLFPKHPPTQISLAQMIQKANPEIKIDFKKARKQKEQEVFLPSPGKQLLEDNDNLQRRIRDIFLERDLETEWEKENNRFHIAENNFNPFPLLTALSFFFFLLLPLFATLFFSYIGFWSLESARESLLLGDLLKAQRRVELSKRYFKIAKSASVPLVAQAKIIGKESRVEPIIKQVSIGENESLAGAYLVGAINKLVNVLEGKSKDSGDDLASFSYMLRNSLFFLQRAGSKDRILQDFGHLIKLGADATDILPEIFGFDRKKIYLLLFQDNLELRPTGGIISSYGLLTIEKGRIKDFLMYDVDNADSQLRGHVEPPYPIRRHLGLKHWYLKDSNFNIDFVESSSKSAFFLNTATNIQTDGVLAIDFSFLKKILSVIGPIYVTDYKKVVSENNFYEVLLTQKEAKKDFLKPFFGSIFLPESLEKGFYAPLTKIVYDSLLEKHILFAFADRRIQDFFTVYNWFSALQETYEEDKRNVISDFVSINEANLGGNKANYFVKRMVSNDIIIDNKGEVSVNLSILYDNKIGNKGSGQDYKNYLRIIFKEKAKLLSILIDDKPQKIVEAVTDPAIYETSKNTFLDTLEVEKIVEDGKSIFGFLVNVPSGKKQKIDIQYSFSNYSFVDKPSFSYRLKYFKQPGTEEYPFNLSISYPLFFQPIALSDEFNRENGKVFLSKNINSDEEIIVRFAKK